MRTPLLFLPLAFLALVVCPAAGQTDNADIDYHVEMPKGVVSTVREKDGKNVRMIDLNFQIKRLRDQTYVTGVPKEEIIVEEDGVKVKELQIFPPRSQKLNVVLAMDISGSMARGRKMDEAKQAALVFLDRLDERADVGLILFDHEIKQAIPLARDPAKQKEHRNELRGIVNNAKPSGGTAYLDATVKAVEMLKGTDGRRVVVVMTDGVDMNSKATLADAIQAGNIGELPIYTVGIGEPGKNDPVTTVLVLDRSGSMAGKADVKDDLTKMDALKRAATRFVELMRRSATTTLLPFSSTIDTAEPFTNNQDLLKKRIRTLMPRDGTLLYDATYAGIETLVAGDLKGRKAVVVLTDGKDESPGSRRSDDEVIERAKEVGLPLYMLGLGHPDEINEPVMKKMAAQTGGEYYHAGNQQKLLEVFEQLSIQLHDDGIDEDSLRELAEKTGGKYLHVSDVSKLQILYETLAEELQSTYRVTFESRRSSHDGTARGIDVKIVRDGKIISDVGSVDDVARGVVVPQMSYSVYLVFLVLLGILLAAPSAIRRLYRAMGGA
jgi:VWFA-related protein